VFEFAALTFAAPENVRFRYRLEGVDSAWSEPDAGRSAQYSRLPAGVYRFQVTACNEAGVWNETGSELFLEVNPFFWQTWWFRILLLLGFTLAVVAVVRLVSFRLLQTRLRHAEQQAALFRDRTRIARDIHDDLGGSLAHIKLLSEIASREQGLPEGSAQQVRQITQTTQQVMKSLDEIVWAINPRNDTLPHLISYLGQHSVEFLRAAGISCSVDLPETPPELVVPSDQRHHLFLAVKEALTNVVRHSGARTVTLRVQLEGSLLLLEIGDDGRGFSQVPDDALADGLRNMRQRIESLGGRFHLDSRPGEGTRLRFELQLS
jgi:signal transduction histidine kinase